MIKKYGDDFNGIHHISHKGELNEIKYIISAKWW